MDYLIWIFLLFWRGLKATLVFQTVILTTIQAYFYLFSDISVSGRDFFLGQGVETFAFFGLNVALIYAFTLVLARGLLVPIIFMVVAMLYSAAMKYLTGSLFLGLDIANPWLILLVGGYVFFLAMLEGLLHGDIETAVTYRTRDDK